MSAAPITTMTTTAATTTSTTKTEPSTAMAVMRSGDTLSNDLMQELVTTVATTASREQLRKRTVLVLGVVGAAVTGGCWAVGAENGQTIPLILFAMACLGPILPLYLGWGVRNRALLNVAADNAAVDHKALARAVRDVEKKKLGPSTALRAALQKDRPKTAKSTTSA